MIGLKGCGCTFLTGLVELACMAAAAAAMNDMGAPPGAGAGAPKVAMVPDPVTGKLTQQLVQTVVDPKTGKTIQIPVSASGVPGVPGGGAAQIITVKDPVTGHPVQQIVETIIDPKTGKPTQVTKPLTNLTQNGK